MASKLQFNALETTADVFPDPRLSGSEGFIFFLFFPPPRVDETGGPEHACFSPQPQSLLC